MGVSWFRPLAPAGDDFWDYFDLADELWDEASGQQMMEGYLNI